MSTKAIPIAFDVLGTCFDLRGAVPALCSACPTLSNSALANVVIDDWFHSAQRDFTYLSMNGTYKPIAQVLKATVPRVLAMHNLLPGSSSTTHDPFTNTTESYSDLLAPVFEQLKKLPARPGLESASETLLSPSESGPPKFRLMAATNGSLEMTKGLFSAALGEAHARKWEYYSCDEDRVAKPAPNVYEAIRQRLGVQEGEECWFVASHTWDLFAAKKAGFKTAFITYEEHFVLEDLFGAPDIVAKDMEDMAHQISRVAAAGGA